MNRLLEISVGSSLLIALLLLTAPLLSKRYSAKWRYWVWLILAVRLLLPFNLTLPSAPVTLSASQQDISFQLPAMDQPQTIVALPANTAGAVTIDTTSTSQLPETASKNHKTPFSLPALPTLLFSLWVFGAVSFLLYHLIGYALFWKGVHRYAKTADTESISAFSELKNSLKIGKNIKLLLHPKLSTPMMAGFFRPALLLSSGIHHDDLAVILTHELIHYKRRDLWYKALLLLAQSVHWFNPLVHLMSRAACRDIETSCDEKILRGADIDIRRRYGETLLRTIRRGMSPRTSLCTNFYGGKNSMKHRFLQLFDLSKKKTGFVLLIIIITGTLIGGTLISCSANEKIQDFVKTAEKINVEIVGIINEKINNQTHLFFKSYNSTSLYPDQLWFSKDVIYSIKDNILTFDDDSTAVINGNITLLGNKQITCLPLKGILVDTKKVTAKSFTGSLQRSIVVKDGSRCYQYTYSLFDTNNNVMVSFYSPNLESYNEINYESKLSALINTYSSKSLQAANSDKNKKTFYTNNRYFTPNGFIDIQIPSKWKGSRIYNLNYEIATTDYDEYTFTSTKSTMDTSAKSPKYKYKEFSYNSQIIARVAYLSGDQSENAYKFEGALLKETKYTIGKTKLKVLTGLQKDYNTKNAKYTSATGKLTITEFLNNSQMSYQYTYAFPYENGTFLIQFYTSSSQKVENLKIFKKILSQIRCVQLWEPSN